ncbi:phage tail tape measure protein [Streptomyces europaeiscabiei]|uniref:phage tail tape measure protein n=1 Tax=Streptomyces europaeiscabiei TaxID=146819 RepID=UPI0029A79E95|nr:phage tail tape measure protein [Streptomyces europaeiscabiei]MDX3634342.1 phage tail tape measure protein [Streptomyces europaeiscabiei]MDX3651810.1 phage tail tape measure protein [Streptomyces europaeiscabiei]
MPSVGYATLQVIPSVRGIGDELRRQLLGPASDAADQAGEQSGSRFGDKWKAGLAAAGAAAGAILVAATVSAVEKERMADRLTAQLGLTGRGAKQAGKIAGDLYSGAVVDSFEDGAAAVRAVMGSGLIDSKATTKSIKAITTQVADLASTFEQDLVGTTNAATQLIRTGLAKDGPAALDLLTVGLQSSADKAGDFLDTINEYSTQFRKAGLDGASAVGLLNQAIRAGARDSDIAADAIKEFSIRAVDGSDSSKEGFKALRLSAKDMATQFAQGGQSANKVLDLTLDKLRNVKDPVKQSQIAVQLFGTQAEDLGAALFAMDPSSAADGLGKLDGAAKKVGDTIRGNTSTELKVLQRQLMDGVGTVVQSVILPSLRGLITAIRWTGEAAGATGRWFREWGAWLLPVITLVGGLTIALNAQAIATTFVTAVFSAYRAAILIGTAVTSGFAAAQAVLNSVMALNPFVLIAIALVALGVALVVAYKKSETFRNIVQAAFKAISVAALWLWDVVLKPVIGLIVKAFQWWWTAAKIYFTAVGVFFYVLGAAAVWLWEKAIWPVIGWIIAGFKLWWTGAKLYFSLVGAGFRAVGAAAVWLWDHAISPVIDLIVGGFKLWWTGVKIYFGFVRSGFRAVGAGATWLWKNAISPALSGIKSVIADGYNVGIRPVFDKLRAAVGKVGDAFATAKDAIKLAWDKVKGIAKAPVAFVVNTVYNSGIVPVWNKVAGAFGAPKLDKMKAFASGGVLPGYTPGRDVHLAALSGGEAIMRPEWTRAVGPGYVNSMNAAARGGGIRGVQRALGLPGFADGGIFGWVKGAASKGVDLAKSGVSWLKDGMKASALAGINKVVKPLIERISGSASLYRDMITKVPEKMVKSLLNFSDTADKKLSAAGIGGKGFKSALAWARTQNGKPYQWGGNGDPSWDCSGFMSAIESVIRGQKPHRRWATGSFSGSTAPAGWKLGAKSPFMIGITNAGVGHTAGTLNGVNVESRGGDGVIVGSRARSYRSSLFTDVYGFKGYAKGTRGATPGWAWVGELGPELVRFGGGEEVLNHRDSLRVAGGMGTLPGYAKGTSSAKARAAARKQIPGDLTGVTRALTASAADIKKAFDELTKDLKATGAAGKVLAASSVKASAKLQALAKQRDSVDARLEAAKSAASDQKKAAQDFFGLSAVGEVATFSDLLGGLKSRQADAKKFQQQIAGLSKKGVSQDIISQLVAQGPGGPLIDLVAGASKSQLGQLNKVAKAGGALSTSYGRTMADAMFDAGTQAGKGFLTGLQAQEAELQKAMNRLGAGLVAAIRKKLKIKSPSKATEWVGEMTGAGVGVGLDKTAATVAAAAARVASAAVPDVPAVSPAGIARTASTPQGLAPGTRLRLVVGEHEFDAYVDDRANARVDAGLTRVRRTAAAGRK